MHSIHAIRWIENLKISNHELFWFDSEAKGKLATLNNVVQFTNWKLRKIPNIKGEHFLYKKFPKVYSDIKPILEITQSEMLEKIILDIKPDVVHSFEMQSISYPMLKTMNKFPQLKWIYSCWGSDLFYYSNFKTHNQKIKNVLKRVDFLHTDCDRDYQIALNLGFKGKHTGIIPGGTGYDLQAYNLYKKPIGERKIILVKGYQHLFGRGLNVIKALQNSSDVISNYEIVVFGAHKEVIDYINLHKLPFKVYDRNELSQNQVIQLMGNSLIYVGNAISDGIPNTLLEAICMNTFPIQSNPGNVTSEIIKNGLNGFLIENPDDIETIQNLIRMALSDKNRIIGATKINTQIAIDKLEYSKIQERIISLYSNLQ
jgi:glycosyltransferase involved in cell wall biosynthesis